MWFGVALFPVLLVLGIAGVDHTLSRPDRIRHTRRIDDQMLLWLDGKLICQHDEQAPVTRSAAREPVRIEKGEHRLRMRVNNRTFSQYGDGRWQASLRIRTQDDQLSRVTGLPPSPPDSPADKAQPTTGN
ncbi:MAG: hypothetical protein A3K19_16690 [Lentisphaerae bacterium RIFOXYB12_FULL_65_16]|nr:MAG: hypothetical protein A3K18_20450 [Lentisphaerae bacterium RIFOXYA12_64_32]OGV89078.1 MAG: hypothetical protein A3K19_16690 [Lentisphaerae bacterium RIFOXYB12_FULL_65_16]